MTKLIIIDPINATHDGPVFTGMDGGEKPVHLAQGSLDGACGPYCLIMCLLICGLLDYEDVTSLKRDGRSRLGKLWKLCDNFGAFFHNGTDIREIVAMLKGTFDRRICVEYSENSGPTVRHFVKNHVMKSHPVILGIEFPEGGHWVVVIGLEYEVDSEACIEYLSRFLILDPGEQSPQISAWNGVIDAIGSGGRYPYTWWTKDTKVSFDCALAVWREK